MHLEEEVKGQREEFVSAEVIGPMENTEVFLIRREDELQPTAKSEEHLKKKVRIEMTRMTVEKKMKKVY